MTVRQVNKITFGNYTIPVFHSVDDPFFCIINVAIMVKNTPENILNQVEHDEKIRGKIYDEFTKSWMDTWFLTENGLYNVLAQGTTQEARVWRRIVHNKLIELRKTLGRDIVEQFEDWNDELDTIYFDDQGRMWQSITVQGGDVEQV